MESFISKKSEVLFLSDMSSVLLTMSLLSTFNVIFFAVSTADSILGFTVSNKLVYARISPDMTRIIIIPVTMPLLN